MALHRHVMATAALALLPACLSAGARDGGMADLLQTLQVSEYLQRDEVLAPLNIGIKVRGRVAILWGPVPTAELALRAEQRLRKMIELIDVRNELIVLPEDIRDVPVPTAPPLYLPEKTPPPLPDRPRPFVRFGDAGTVVAWHAASAKR